MTTLQPATPDEFAAYRAYAMNDAGADRATRQDFDRHFPDGPQTKNRHALSIRTANGAHVGLLWFLVAERPTGPEAFLMDIVIFPPHRRHGHAREALQQLDHSVDRLGLETISLSVSPENTVAAALYHALGYEPVFTRMTKRRGGRSAG